MRSFIYLAWDQTWKIVRKDQVFASFSSSLSLCYSSFFPYLSFFLIQSNHFYNFTFFFFLEVSPFSVSFMVIFITGPVFWIPQSTCNFHPHQNVICCPALCTFPVEYQCIRQTRKIKVPQREKKDIFCSLLSSGEERVNVFFIWFI